MRRLVDRIGRPPGKQPAGPGGTGELQLGHRRGAGVAGAPLRRVLHGVGTGGSKSRVLAAQPGTARGTGHGGAEGSRQAAVPAAAPLGREHQAQHVVLQPQQRVSQRSHRETEPVLKTPTLVSNEAADSHSQEILRLMCRIGGNNVQYQDDHEMSH